VPYLGQRVLYTLTGRDAADINRRRGDFTAFSALHRDATASPGELPGRSGHVGHVGRPCAGGDMLPGEVVFISDDGTTVELRVSLRGSDVHYVEAAAMHVASAFRPWPAPGTWAPAPQPHAAVTASAGRDAAAAGGSITVRRA
jgi:hypothetical protein